MHTPAGSRCHTRVSASFNTLLDRAELDTVLDQAELNRLPDLTEFDTLLVQAEAWECALPPSMTIIVGCTSSGKGSLGFELAGRAESGGEIVSMDSMKVYRRMDIGTAKPSPSCRAKIRYHVIDLVDPWEAFSVAEYVKSAEGAIADIKSRGKTAFVVGGTILYFKALTEGLFAGPGADPVIRARLNDEAAVDGPQRLHERLLGIDPVAAGRLHPNDLRRVVRALEVHELTGRRISDLQEQWDRERTKYEFRLLGLRRDREDQAHRINARVRRMIDDGLVDEVASLMQDSRGLGATAGKAVGYAEIMDHLEGRSTLADAIEMIKINTRQLAKSQRTWIRRLRNVEWVDVSPDAVVSDIADELLKRRDS